MKNILSKAFLQIKEFWTGRNKKQKKTLIVSTAIGLVLIVFLTFLFNTTKYEVLYSSLDSGESGEILNVLEGMSVDAKTRGDDTILVPAGEADRLKMLLAADGYPKSTLNYDIFTNNISFMTTDFEKTQYLLFQLQERLQASIKTLDGIQSAIVTISLPNNDYTVLQKDKVSPSASVVLSTAYGTELSSRQIKGIEQLVVKSVPGLTSENVSIISNSGQQLNGTDQEEGAGGADSRFELEKLVQNDVQKRIMEVLMPVYGQDELSVGVNVKLDFDAKLTEKTTYGDSGTVSHEDSEYEGTQPKNTSEQGAPGYNSGTNADDPYYRETSGKDYLVDTTKEQIEKASGTITDLTVSVLVNRKELSEQELQRIVSVVSKTCGIEQAKVYVGNAEFSDRSSIETPVQTKLSWRNFTLFGMSTAETYAAIGAALMLFVLMLVILSVFKKAKKPQAVQQKPAQADMNKNIEVIENVDLIMKDTKEQRMKKQVEEFASTNPEITAQLIKTLLKGDMD